MAQEKNDYNKTLNLPQTTFDMRAGLPKKEPGFVAHWDEMDLNGKMLKKNEGKPLYVLHDGPPYANGDIHLGTALNKVFPRSSRRRKKSVWTKTRRPPWRSAVTAGNLL